jgi:arginine repressor
MNGNDIYSVVPKVVTLLIEKGMLTKEELSEAINTKTFNNINESSTSQFIKELKIRSKKSV